MSNFKTVNTSQLDRFPGKESFSHRVSQHATGPAGAFFGDPENLVGILLPGRGEPSVSLYACDFIGTVTDLRQEGTGQGTDIERKTQPSRTGQILVKTS